MTRIKAREQEAFARMAEAFHPQRPLTRNLVAAFWVGGVICVIGQLILDFLTGRGIPQIQALSMTSTAMVITGATLTGLGIYDRIGVYAGMGAGLPITGFANSMVSPALEFKREGFILGVSARMFQIAGPVIVYGSISAIIVSFLRVFAFR